METWVDITTAWLVASERGEIGETGTIFTTRHEAVEYAKKSTTQWSFPFRVYRVVLEGVAVNQESVFAPVVSNKRSSGETDGQ